MSAGPPRLSEVDRDFGFDYYVIPRSSHFLSKHSSSRLPYTLKPMLALGRYRHCSSSLQASFVGALKRTGQQKARPLRRSQTTSSLNAPAKPSSSVRTYLALPATLLALYGLGYVAYENSQPFRHTVLAVVRCSRVAGTSRPFRSTKGCRSPLYRGRSVGCHRLQGHVCKDIPFTGRDR